MRHTDKELAALKASVSEMWQLVLSQLEKSKQACLTGDMELAREVVSREKRVDTLELKIDSDCENYIALFAPVAVDLRLVLSLIKIAGALERIGDYAEGIARHVMEEKTQKELVQKVQVEQMMDIVISMLSDSYLALESENTRLSGRIMHKDEKVDALYIDAVETLAAHMEATPGAARDALDMILVARKIERVGDHCSNIVEDIVFYIDAKVLKHRKKY